MVVVGIDDSDILPLTTGQPQPAATSLPFAVVDMERSEGGSPMIGQDPTATMRYKRWADFASLVSIFLIIGLLCVADYLAESAAVDQSTRTGMFIAVVGIVIVVSIWQAAAFVAASVERVLRRRDSQGP
jgi:hypothetical protein